MHAQLDTTLDNKLLNVEFVRLSNRATDTEEILHTTDMLASRMLRGLFILIHKPTAHLTELAFVTGAPSENPLLGPSRTQWQCTWELPVPCVVFEFPSIVLYHFVLISLIRVTREVI